MRTTLHVVPLDLAPIVHQSTLSLRLAEFARTYRQLDATTALVAKIRNTITQLVQTKPRTSHDISRLVIARHSGLSSKSPAHTILVRTVIKHLWEEGTLCYVNASDRWDSEERLYGATNRIYPTLNLASCSVHEAQRRLVYQHIKRYGPLTLGDISWWSGLGRSIVARCLGELRSNLVEVAVEGLPGQFYMTRQDLDNFRTFRTEYQPWIQLLAYEDPSLKGYFESRARYIAPKYYDLLFNQIGEARPSIVVNGEVVGTWSWTRKDQRLVWRSFRALTKDLTSQLGKIVASLEACLQEDYRLQVSGVR